MTQAAEIASRQGRTAELDSLLGAVEDYSNVVVSLPAAVALSLVTDDSFQYVNYEKLVGSGARGTAVFANDAQRKIVSGALFGSLGEEIIYGVLSLSDRGLASYGDVYCRLKRVAVVARASFLETNSYDFVRKYGDTAHPAGYRSDWANRGKLVAVKLVNARLLKKGASVADWEKLLLVSDATNRNLDDFIEAHVFGTFTLHSIETMVPAIPGRNEFRSIVEGVIEAFRGLSSATRA